MWRHLEGNLYTNTHYKLQVRIQSGILACFTFSILTCVSPYNAVTVYYVWLLLRRLYFDSDDKRIPNTNTESQQAQMGCQKLAKFFCLKIGRNENFIMQMAYGDEMLFYNFFKIYY